MRTRAMELTAAEVRRRCDPKTLDFDSTARLAPLDDPVGQERAIEALELGLAITSPGFHVFAVGPNGTGRTSLVLEHLRQAAAAGPPPSDWCYVMNFDDPNRPRCLELPAGAGCRLQHDMEELILDLEQELPTLFQSDAYRQEVKALEAEFRERQEALVGQVMEEAVAGDFRLIPSDHGLLAVPVVDGRVVPPQQIASLPEDVRERLQAGWSLMKGRVADINSGLRVARQEVRRRIGDLDEDLIQFAVASAMHELRDRYAEVPQVMNYLDAVQEDAIRRVHDFKVALDSDAGSTNVHRPDTSRYRVNLLVGNCENAKVPVVVEANPTPRNLIGRIDHEVRQGALVTDMSMIRAGALHRANGGYLMIEAREVLLRPSAWDVLKRSLSENRIRMETMEEEQRAASTRSLAPEPVDLQIKVVLVGDEDLYQTLHERDEEFRELFKVKAEFETETRWDDDAALRYARFVGELCRREALLPFDASGVARWVEHASRLADDNRRLATRFGILADVAREAAHCAAIRQSTIVEAADVRAALEARDRRVSRAEDRIRRTVVDGAIRIEVEGEVIGQVNGLVVSNTGDHAFGRPVRVTARTHVGMTGVVAIERETELGGRIHTKGVLTLAGFLGGLVAHDVPLALSASLSLEQSYAGVDGDSASSTELYALVSSLAELPARQGIAVTGAVDQRGQILAVGSVSEKIEGFFDLCRERGLTGEQGVMLPVANVHNLMLREDVVEAVAAGRFHVWAIDTIDEGLELLLGRPAGRRETDGSWTPDSVWYRVEDRLHELADHARSWTVSGR